MPGESREVEEPHEPAPKKAAPRSKAPIGALIGIAVLLAIVLVPWLLRSTIATSMVRGELATAGVSCDERFSVELSAFLSSATIEPTRCTVEEGHVEAIEITTPAEVELSGLAPSAVHADQVRLTLRARDLRGGSGWDGQLRQLNLEQRVAGLVKGLAELSELDLPQTTVARVEVIRGDDDMAEITAMTLTPGSPLGVTIDSVLFTAVMGAAQLTLSGVTGTAASAQVHLEGQATARAAIAFLGVSREGTFTLDASQLDSSPSFRLRSNL